MEGLIGVLILIADIWAILNIANSSATNGAKALWIVLVLRLPNKQPRHIGDKISLAWSHFVPSNLHLYLNGLVKRGKPGQS